MVALTRGSEWCEAEVQNLFEVYRDPAKSTWFPSELYTIYQLSHNRGLQEGQARKPSHGIILKVGLGLH